MEYSEAMNIKKVKDLESLLIKQLGYSFKRQAGSHAIFVKPFASSVSIPVHGKDIARGTLRQVLQVAYNIKG